MTTLASQITSLTIVYSTVYSDADQRKHQSSASLAFVWGTQRHRWIPRTKGQLRGKCFHLMTSSWVRKWSLYACVLMFIPHVMGHHLSRKPSHQKNSKVIYCLTHHSMVTSTGTISISCVWLSVLTTILIATRVNSWSPNDAYVRR